MSIFAIHYHGGYIESSRVVRKFITTTANIIAKPSHIIVAYAITYSVRVEILNKWLI
jgi:hypothetical protein